MQNSLADNVLLIPIHLDILNVPRQYGKFGTRDFIPVMDRILDFSKLPFYKGQDYNIEIPYLGDSIMPKPFQNENTPLGMGLHLHWTLPDALTHGSNQSGSLEFPLVPDRWLITRKLNGNIEKQWIVESNYINSSSAVEENGKAYYFVGDSGNVRNNASEFTNVEREGKKNPYSFPSMFIGRYQNYSDWLNGTPDSNLYFKNLNAVANGDPTFASLYSNCPSSFGFHDPDYKDFTPRGLEYEIIGWYNNLSDDELYKLRQKHQGDNFISEFKQEVEEYFQWTLEGDQVPEQLVCYAKSTFKSGTSSVSSFSDSLTPDVVLANTTSEALSALLAQKLQPDDANMIEEQLMYISLSNKIEEQQLDLGAKFFEARHTDSFHYSSAGIIWSVRYDQQTQSPTDPSLEATQVSLPDVMAHQLNELNTAQSQYDQLSDKIDKLSHDIYTDWCQYMFSTYHSLNDLDVYPDPDLLKFFIQSKDFAFFDTAQNEKGELSYSFKSDPNGISFSANESNTVAAKVAYWGNALQDAIDQYNEGKELGNQLTLATTKSPRFWEPHEPVILLSGNGAKPTSRHGLDGTLKGHVMTFDPGTKLQDQLTDIDKQIEAFPVNTPGISIWNGQPWNPLLLEWELNFNPAEKAYDPSDYDPQYINENYELKENTVELTPKASPQYSERINHISGINMLTDTSGEEMQMSLENYLDKTVMPEYYAENPDVSPEDNYLNENIDDVVDWYDSYTDNPSYSNPVYTALHAYQLLLPLEYLAQSLVGFNQALIMLKDTYPLDIKDPFAFGDGFPRNVDKRVGDNLTFSPRHDLSFYPFRSGLMKFIKMNLVDTFGQIRTISLDSIYSSPTLPSTGAKNVFQLPPRLVQPAQLNLRWLSAINGEQEMNSHPATTPICGWILPNHLDQNLLVYNSEGASLGAITINPEQMWQPNPGDPNPVSIEQIENPYLKAVVEQIIARGTVYLIDFLDVVGSSLDNIQPESYIQGLGPSVLIGRPIAVTRIKLDLQLQGGLAHHQGWNALRQDMTRNFRETSQYESVVIPLRVGEYNQLNDGVVGYWIEEGAAFQENIFYAPQSDVEGNPHIVSRADQPINLSQSISQDPSFLTVLFDPRGKLHVTSGLLPTKVLNIPPDQYAPYIENLDVSFLAAPIITGNSIQVPLPLEGDFRWLWSELRPEGYWREVSTQGTVHKEDVLRVFAEDGEEVWNTLLDQSIYWLQQTSQDFDNEATIVPTDLRKSDNLGSLNDQKETIKSYLQSAYLKTDVSERFKSEQQHIKEGWLKLRRFSDLENPGEE